MKKKRVNYQNASKERKPINTKKISFIVFSLKKEDWGNGESTSLFDVYEHNENHKFSDADISTKPTSMRGG